MAGIFSGDFRLQQENKRLKRELAHAKADNIELLHQNARQKEEVVQWKAYGQHLGVHGQTINENLERLREQVQCLAESQERDFSKMPTREELDQVKQELQQAIANETQQVTNEIQALKDQLASGQPITQQDLDDLRASVQAVSQIDPDAAPQPSPEPAPGRGRQ